MSLYTFLPANRLRKMLSVNPMDHRPYLPIWRGAYLSTLQRIHLLRHRMCGDLAAHGLALDTSRAEAVAARLEATTDATFADFFPDGKVNVVRGMKPGRGPPARGRAPRRRDRLSGRREEDERGAYAVSGRAPSTRNRTSHHDRGPGQEWRRPLAASPA